LKVLIMTTCLLDVSKLARSARSQTIANDANDAKDNEGPRLNANTHGMGAQKGMNRHEQAQSSTIEHEQKTRTS
jgi:hypothetical protein